MNLDQGSITKLEEIVIDKNEENRIKQKQEELIKAQKYPAAADLNKKTTDPTQ